MRCFCGGEGLTEEEDATALECSSGGEGEKILILLVGDLDDAG